MGRSGHERARSQCHVSAGPAATDAGIAKYRWTPIPPTSSPVISCTTFATQSLSTFLSLSSKDFFFKGLCCLPNFFLFFLFQLYRPKRCITSYNGVIVLLIFFPPFFILSFFKI